MARALELAKSLAGVTTKDARADIVEELARLGGFAPRKRGAKVNDLVPIERFSAAQQEVLREVARAGADMLAARPAGVPSRGWDFRPWTGVAPARVLETLTSTNEGMKPRWLVFQEAGLAGIAWPDACKAALAGLDAAGRVEAIFLVVSAAYALRMLFPEQAWGQELEGILRASGEAGARYAVELVERLGSDEALRNSLLLPDPTAIEPLLLTAHARGVRLPASLHHLIPWRMESRPLLETLSAEERANLVTRVTAHWGAPNLEMEMDNIEALADLLVTPELVAHLRTIIEGDEELESLYAARLDALEHEKRP
jgi:hypothetical protein